MTRVGGRGVRMTRGFARVLIWFFAWLAPRALRARWREEWLAEIDAGRPVRPASILVGAPTDALAARADAVRHGVRAIAAGLRTDFAQTCRGLIRSPRHVLTVVFSLGIGLTLSVSVFSVVNSLLYGDVPGVHDRRSLARVFIGHAQTVGSENFGRPGVMSAETLSVSDFESLDKDAGPSLSGLAGEGDLRVAVSLSSTTTGAIASFVTPSYFPVVGTPVLQGRLLTADDGRPGAPAVVVVGFHLWRDRLGAAADLVGRSILIGGKDFTVVGIAPPRFVGIEPSDPASSPLDFSQLWIPLRHAAGWAGAPGPDRPWLSVVGRMAPPTTIDDVRASLTVPAARRAAERPDIRTSATYLVRSHGFGPNDSPTDVLIMLAMILAIPLTVLAVSCANVANLQLARATTRARELAVRMALGASRGQIVRLLVLEAALLALASTLAGWLGAATTITLAQSYFPLILTLDHRVLIFALSLTTGVTLLSGLAPAWLATRRSMAGDLKRTHQGGGLAHARLRHGLVVAQVAASFVLLAGSNVFVRTSYAVQADVPRAIAEQLVVSFDVGMLGYGPADANRLTRDLRTRLGADARVDAVSFERDTSGRYGSPDTDLDNARFTSVKEVSPDFAAVTDARVVAGRWLEATDGPQAVVVNERMARQLDPDGRAVGRRVVLRTGADEPRLTLDIIGVIENQKRRVDDFQPDAAMYRLLPAAAPTVFDVRIRTRNAAAVAGDLRGIVESVDARLPWAGFWFGRDLYAGEFDAFRYAAMAVGGFGVVALLVAAGGLYAVMAYVVSLRQREFGIRIAIGARPEDLTAIVGRLALRLAGWGLAVGLAIAVPLGFAMRAMIVGVSLSIDDPWSWLPVIAALAAVTLLAALVPARRAARVDPIRVLRVE